MKAIFLFFSTTLLFTVSTFTNAQPVPYGKRLKDIPAGPKIGITASHGRLGFDPNGTTGLLSSPFQNEIQTIVNREFNFVTALCYPNKYDGWGDGDVAGAFQYDRFNDVVNWIVQRNKLPMMHMLCGPNIYYPRWFKYGNWSATEQDSLLRTWIYGIMESNDNKNKVKIWNVINESLNDDGKFKTNNSLNNNGKPDSTNWCKFYEMGVEPDVSGLSGSEKINDFIPIYIRKAFEYAADKTNNILELRDYGIEEDGLKAKAFYQLVRHLLNKGVKLGAVGPQCHFSLAGDERTLKIEEFKIQIKRYTDLGLQVYFTELDVEDKNPPFTEAKAETQKEIFKNTIRVAIQTGVSGVILWGIADSNFYWLPNGSPQTFTKEFVAKPAYYGVQEALNEAVFKYDTLPTGTYSFKAKHSGKLLKVKQSSTENGATVWQYSLTSSIANQWQVKHVEGGYHKLIAACSGKALDVSGISYKDGALLQQWEYGAGDNQLWKFEKQPNGFYKISARHSGKALDVVGISKDEGALVQQWRFGNGDNQLWSLEKISNTVSKNAVNIESNKLKLFPNPSVNGITQLTYFNNTKDEKANLQIINEQGVVIQQKQIVLQNGINTFSINTSLMTSGIYTIMVSTLQNKKDLIQKLEVIK